MNKEEYRIKNMVEVILDDEKIIRMGNTLLKLSMHLLTICLSIRQV